MVEPLWRPVCFLCFSCGLYLCLDQARIICAFWAKKLVNLIHQMSTTWTCICSFWLSITLCCSSFEGWLHRYSSLFGQFPLLVVASVDRNGMECHPENDSRRKSHNEWRLYGQPRRAVLPVIKGMWLATGHHYHHYSSLKSQHFWQFFVGKHWETRFFDMRYFLNGRPRFIPLLFWVDQLWTVHSSVPDHAARIGALCRFMDKILLLIVVNRPKWIFVFSSISLWFQSPITFPELQSLALDENLAVVATIRTKSLVKPALVVARLWFSCYLCRLP